MTDDLLDVKISQLLVATADDHDELIDDAVVDVLRTLRSQMRMDVVFVSEFTATERVFRFVDQGPTRAMLVESEPPVPALRPGDANPLEESFCKLVAEGRLPQCIGNVAALPPSPERPVIPFRIGAHLSVPVRLRDGRIYGTVCCFSQTPNTELSDRDLRPLQQVATVLARRLDHRPPPAAAA